MTVSRKIAQGFIILVVAGLSLVLAAGIWKEKGPKSGDEAPEAPVSGTEMKLTEMEFTEMEQGRRFWTLHAAEAIYLQDKKRTFLKNVHLVFFLENNEEIHLESNEGAFSTATKNIQLFNGVKATLPRGYVVTTQKALYFHAEKKISSDKAIQLRGPGTEVDGNVWEYRISDGVGMAGGGVSAFLDQSKIKIE